MAMQKKVRRELRKLRELVYHFLEGERCYFCEKLLVSKSRMAFIKFGDADAPPLGDLVRTTIHHVNENHADDRKVNRSLAHQSCHKSHHMKQSRPCDSRKVVVMARRAA